MGYDLSLIHILKVTKGGGKDQNVFLSTYMGGDGWRNGWMMYWRNADGGIYRATWGETGGNICEPSLKAPEEMCIRDRCTWCQWRNFD